MLWGSPISEGWLGRGGSGEITRTEWLKALMHSGLGERCFGGVVVCWVFLSLDLVYFNKHFLSLGMWRGLRRELRR